MTTRLKLALVTTAVTAAGVTGFCAHAVLATPAPLLAPTPFTYSGLLTNELGTPISGVRSITVELYDTLALGTRQCITGPENITIGEDGRFSIPLTDPACLTAIKAKSDLFIQVKVDTATLPRTKIGAVPYAGISDEAAHAGSADSVPFAGVAPSVTPTTQWPGTVPGSRVTSSVGGLSLEQRVATLELESAKSQPKTIVLAATFSPDVPTPQVLSVAQGGPDGSWITSTTNTGSNFITLFYAPVISGMGCTVSRAEIGSFIIAGNVLVTPAQKKIEVQMFGSSSPASVTMTIVCVGQLP